MVSKVRPLLTNEGKTLPLRSFAWERAPPTNQVNEQKIKESQIVIRAMKEACKGLRQKIKKESTLDRKVFSFLSQLKYSL